MEVNTSEYTKFRFEKTVKAVVLCTMGSIPNDVAISEDLAEKLNFNHIGTQQQILRKFYNDVVKFSKKIGAPLSPVTGKECQSLHILLTLMGNENLNIGKICSGLLLDLVYQNVLSPAVLISSAMTLSALSKPIKNFIGEILMILLQEKNSMTTLTTLTRIFSNQAINTTAFFDEIQKFIIDTLEKSHSTSDVERVLNALQPFFVYVVSKPQHCMNFTLMLLQTESIIQLKRKSKPIVFKILLNCLNDKINCKVISTEYLKVTVHMAIWYLDQKIKGPELGEMLISVLLSMLWNCVKTNQSNHLEQSLNLLKILIQSQPLPLHLKKNVIIACSLLLTDVFGDDAKLSLLEIVLSVLPDLLQSDDLHHSQQCGLMLMLPLLQILSDNETKQPKLKSLASNILINVENLASVEYSKVDLNTAEKAEKTNSEIMNIGAYTTTMMSTLLSCDSSALNWLTDVSESKEPLANNIIYIIVAILLKSHGNQTVVEKCLDALNEQCKLNSVLVPYLFPLFMYCLNNKKFINMKIPILFTVPKLAVGKMTISPVLKLLTLISTNNELLPTSIRLMTSLWKRQRRIFPYLLQMLNKTISDTPHSQIWFDLMLSKATSISEICQLKPEQYGQDLVVLLSNMMESLVQVEVSPLQVEKMECVSSSLSLVIESLRLLCLAKVIDIQTIWKAIILKVQPKKNEMINRSLCSFSDAIAHIYGEIRIDFQCEVVEYLWFIAQSEGGTTSSFSYGALSHFSPSLQKVKYLPKQIQELTCQQLLSMKEHKDDETFDPLLEACPGYGYVALLKTLEPTELPGFKKLLTKVLREEINALPRGVGRRSLMKPTQSMTSFVPDVLRHLYESSTRPGVLPGLAASLLSCYEPKIRGLDPNKPSPIHVKAIMERYKQTLNSILQDYTINSNDWSHVINTSKLWTSFMNQVYQVFIEGRIADLDIQLEKGEITDKESFEEEVSVAKYWARDQIINQLKTAAKGTPKVQGNSIFALVGLANAVSSMEDENVGKEESHQYVSMRHWMLKVFDTVLVVFDGNAKIHGKPFQWCQQVSSDKSSASSFVSRCAAAISLSEMVRPLLALDAGRILQMINTLKERCPGQSKAGTSSVLHFYTGIGYGMLMSRLSQIQSAGVMATFPEFNMVEYMKILKKAATQNGDEEYEKDGAIIGYFIALSSLVYENDKKTPDEEILAQFDQLIKQVNNLQREELTALQAQCYCFGLSSLTVALERVGAIKTNKVFEIRAILQKHVELAPQASDLYLSLGWLNNHVLRKGDDASKKEVNQLLKTWEVSMSQKETPTLHRLGMVKGVLSTLGCLNIHCDGDFQSAPETSEMKSALKKVVKNLETSKDVLVSLISARLLGELHLATNASSKFTSQLPSSYMYIGEKSNLSALFEILLKEESSDTNIFKTVLDVFVDTGCPKLPPVSWTPVMNRLHEPSMSEEVRLAVVDFVLTYASSCVDLSLWLSSLIQPSAFNRLDYPIQSRIFDHVSRILHVLPNSKQKILLEEIPLVVLTKNKNNRSIMLESVLKSWLSVAEMKEPIQSSFTHLNEGVRKMITSLEQLPQVWTETSQDLFARLLEKLSLDQNILLSKIDENLKIEVMIRTLEYRDVIEMEYLVLIIQSIGEHSDLLANFLSRIASFKGSEKKMATLHQLHAHMKQRLILDDDKETGTSVEKLIFKFVSYLCNDQSPDGIDTTWLVHPIKSFNSEDNVIALRHLFMGIEIF
ncbi:focadhesin-like isoform X2 [Clytia hemisphaerica]|uniref:DUF3730 domain-containing protein n=1 Tax=Clytia hemisphaerica TaxID=252671 RepID=A0A7M5X782_9CNID